MKKTIKHIVPIVIAAVAATGCIVNDNIEPNVPDAKRELKVAVDNSLLSDTKATFTDGTGFAWEAGDNSNFYCLPYGATGSTASTGVTIGADSKATFTFDSIAAESNIWFLYGGSIEAVESNKKEYKKLTTQVQDAPGVLEKTRLALVSEPITIDAATTTINPTMKLAVGLQRFLVYSPTGAYASEQIKSVSMTANEDIGGVIGFSKDGKYCDMGGASCDEPVIYWDPSKSTTVLVTNPAKITATDRESTLGQGIYMASFPTTLTAGYFYVVTTDVAIYRLPAATVGTTIENGKLHNVFINLEGAGITRTDVGLPQVKYDGNIAGPYNYGSAAQDWLDIGWWFANVSANGEPPWIPHEGDELCNIAGFQSNDNITFTYTDDSAELNPVTWLECRYKAGTSHWEIRYDENTTDASRTCIVTATFNIPGYEVVNSPKTVRITQKAKSSVREVTYEGEIAAQYDKAYTAITADAGNGKRGLSWWYATVDGVTMNQTQPNYLTYYDNCTFTITDQPDKAGDPVDWCTCEYRANDTWWDITLTENPYNVARTCYITADFADIAGHIITNPTKSTIIIQAANPEGTAPAE